jgi:hypothetical protein
VLLSLPLLLRVRLGRFADPVPAEALERPETLGARLARLLPPIEIDLLLIERLETGERGEVPPAAGSEPVRFGLLGVLEVPAATVVPPALAAVTVGPAERLGSERAVLLELVARAPRTGDAIRYLQMAAPHEAGEVLASRSVAAELEGRGGRIVGGPAPPYISDRGELLTRV